MAIKLEELDAFIKHCEDVQEKVNPMFGATPIYWVQDNLKTVLNSLRLMRDLHIQTEESLKEINNDS